MKSRSQWEATIRRSAPSTCKETTNDSKTTTVLFILYLNIHSLNILTWSSIHFVVVEEMAYSVIMPFEDTANSVFIPPTLEFLVFNKMLDNHIEAEKSLIVDTEKNLINPFESPMSKFFIAYERKCDSLGLGRLVGPPHDGQHAVYFHKVSNLALLFLYFVIRNAEINHYFLGSTWQDRMYH